VPGGGFEKKRKSEPERFNYEYISRSSSRTFSIKWSRSKKDGEKGEKENERPHGEGGEKRGCHHKRTRLINTNPA